jgi:hypothetical protein
MRHGSGDWMQQIPRNLIMLLGIAALGVGLKREPSLPVALFPAPGILDGFPYQVASFKGRDVETADADALRDFCRPARVVFREYRDEDGYRLKLLVAPVLLGSKDPVGCLLYSGWFINYMGEAFLSTPPLKIRQVLALPPPGRAEEDYACVYYWRGRSAGYKSELLSRLQERINTVLGREEYGLLVTVSTYVKDQSHTDDTFMRLRAFASTVDPLIDAAAQQSSSLVTQRPGQLRQR